MFLCRALVYVCICLQKIMDETAFFFYHNGFNLDKKFILKSKHLYALMTLFNSPIPKTTTCEPFWDCAKPPIC